MSSEEAKLKKVLGLPRVMAITIGQIIGVGVMSLTGIGIALTGSGVTPAFILSAILTVITTLPTAVTGSAIPTTGGMFAIASTLNSTLSWVTKGMLIACEDGWLPKRLAAVD